MISHKIRIKPNKEQIQILEGLFGYSRYCYNRGLAYRQEQHALGNKLSSRDVRNYLRSNREEWEKQYSTMVLETAIEDLDKAIDGFFKKRSKYPKFKNKHKAKQSFRYARKNYSSLRIKGNIWELNRHCHIKMTETLRFGGTIKTITCSKQWGKYYISITTDYEKPKTISFPDKSVGLDFGLLHFVTTSDEKTYAIPQRLAELEQQLDFRHKQISHKERNSKRYIEAKTKLDRMYEAIHNVKQDYINKLSHELCSKYNHIAIEDLSMKNMSKFNKRWRRKLSRMPWHEFTSKLQEKCLDLVKIGRFEPTSKTCSVCGHVKDAMSLGDRTYVCDECGHTQDRDLNAAINIKNVALI